MFQANSFLLYSLLLEPFLKGFFKTITDLSPRYFNIYLFSTNPFDFFMSSNKNKSKIGNLHSGPFFLSVHEELRALQINYNANSELIFMIWFGF